MNDDKEIIETALRCDFNNYINFLYLDWKNNFLTTTRFAEYYEIPVNLAREVIARGRANVNANKGD